MLLKKLFTFSLGLLLVIATINTHAEPSLKPFMTGSYQEILTDNANKPFMLIVWSVDCASCLKDMALLHEIHKTHPDLKMIMLAANELAVSQQAEDILKQHSLNDIENWVFAEEDSQKLRFEIDPKWYGELPRTYFFNAAHERVGLSGAMSKPEMETMLTKILK